MHELALMESLVTSVTEEIGAARVTTVRLEVGRLSCVVPEALLFCFDICTEDTPLAGAVLEIIEIPGRARCRSCGESVAVDVSRAACDCGSLDLDVLTGEELRLKEVEVTDVSHVRL